MTDKSCSPATVTLREAVATELVAHGEFSSAGNNYPNALLAADAVIAIVQARSAATDRVLADELMAFHDCCTQDAGGGDGSFRVECSSGSDAQARALRAVLRQAAAALRSRHVAQSEPHPAVKAITFAVENLQDDFERMEFLQCWLHGSLDEWPDFKDYSVSSTTRAGGK